MTAASSGDPGGSGRRLPTYMDPTNKFGELTFLQLLGKDNAPLPKNPFLIGKSVETVAGGPIEGASTEERGTRYTLRVRNPSQVEKLLKMSELIDGTEVFVQPHPNLNVSRCVISCFDLIDMEEKDVLIGLISQGVIRVQRITRNDNGNRVNTSTLILTFARCNYPAHVKIGLLCISTRPYYPNPLLCYGCFRYGHPRVRCPGPQRCIHCSAERHVEENEECGEAAHCINCGGSHRPNSRQCPIYKKETEVIRIKVDRNLTYPEARKHVEASVRSYAAAAAQPSADRQKLDELEKEMKKKDAQIAELLESMKRKDEKIDKLIAHINSMSAPNQPTQQPQQQQQQCQQQQQQQHQQQNQQKQQHQQVRESRAAGSSMQLRTRSPADKELRHDKPGKKKKRNKSDNTSPGRQSPPLKKTIPEQRPEQDSETVSIDEESEIDETPPSQHHRRH